MTAQNDTVANAVKVATEALIAPGSSLMLDGEMKPGMIHLVAGFAAKALFGPVGWLLVASNSFSKSTTQKHLHQHFIGSGKKS